MQSVANALSPKSEKESIETPVGFAWLPLTRNEHFLILNNDLQEFDLPVASTLAAGYIHYQSMGQGKGHKGPDIKWLDNGRPLFRVRLRLISSVFTTEDNLQAFFQSCQKLYDFQISAHRLPADLTPKETTPPARSCSPEAITDSSNGTEEKLFDKIANKAGALYDVEIYRLIPHFHIVLRRLFALLPICKSNEVALKLISVTIGIVDSASTNGYNYVLKNFVRFHFSFSSSEDGEETTHGAICKFLIKLLDDMRGEERALARIFRQLWFFLDIVIKSMAQWLMKTKKFKAGRKDRFPADLLFRIDGLVDSVIGLICKNHCMPETNNANAALAYFLRCCLSLIDRHAIFNRIHYIVETYDRYTVEDPTTSRQSHILRNFKFDILQILAGHEHWIPLSLPLLTDRYNTILRGGGPTGVYNEIQNNSGFISRFFALFSSSSSPHSAISSSSYNDMNDIEKIENYSDHFWVSESYCKMHFLTGVLIQELMASLREPRDYRPLVIGLIRNLLAKHSSDYRYTDKIAQGRISLLYLPLIQFAIDNIKEIDATAKVVSEAPEVAATMSLGVTWIALSTYNSNSIKSKQSHDSQQQNLILNDTKKSENDGIDKPSTTPLAEKLSKCEARDILLSVLFVLSKIPKKMILNIWRLQETKGNPNGLIDFLHLLELSLQMFAYPGKNYLLKQQAKKRYLQSKAAATVNFQFNEKSRTPSIYGGSDLPLRTGTMESQNSSATATTEPPSSSSLPIDGNDDFDSSAGALAFFKECSLTQEVGITVLDIAQAVSTELAVRCNNLTTEATDISFNKLLLLYIRLLDESWPESVRLNSLASLSIFISHFTSKFFYQGPMEPLSVTIEAMLLQLNSRYPRIQQASAALLQAILRKGYEVIFEQKAKEAAIESVTASKKSSKLSHKNNKGIEILGRPGAQTSVALARLLGQRVPLATSPYFDRGLSALEALIASQTNEKKLSPFESAVMELISQLRGVLSATGALSEAADDPIRLAELHIQLADSYRGSARLRCTWFDTLAETHINERWYSEAAICQAHSIVIIAKELSQKQLITVDWSLLDFINERITVEENVGAAIELDNIQQAGFTLVRKN
uniref:C2 DOCK-type domain-containing protein n=1 Tax=Panagrolaimus superbus TaxID=310955 RepID=A0A914YXU5_9BILA